MMYKKRIFNQFLLASVNSKSFKFISAAEKINKNFATCNSQSIEKFKLIYAYLQEAIPHMQKGRQSDERLPNK